MLLPFVAGMLIAYFLDPVVDRLERVGILRGIASALILMAFFLLAAGFLMLLFPALKSQMLELVIFFPGMIESFRHNIEPVLREFIAGLPSDTLNELRTTAGSFAAKATKWLTQFLSGIWSGGIAVFNIISLLLITPLVAFYFITRLGFDYFKN